MTFKPTINTVLVTGIHREELDFGDRVAALLDSEAIDVLRIPHGVSQRCSDIKEQFYYETRQRELYLQLYQQVRRQYALLIDLHSGWDEHKPSADIYCAQGQMLKCLETNFVNSGLKDLVRLVRIVDGEKLTATDQAGIGVMPAAKTSIPSALWAGDEPVYVGLEMYLCKPGDMSEAAALACRLVSRIHDCNKAPCRPQ